MVSVKRRSTYTTSLSFIIFITFVADITTPPNQFAQKNKTPLSGDNGGH
jgi:hypothetical protein